MRSNYLVTYDIRDEKRLRDIYRKMRGYGNALQYSVFLCRLSYAEKLLMIEAIQNIIKQNEDSVIIIYLGNNSGKGLDEIKFIGVKPEVLEDRAVVI